MNYLHTDLANRVTAEQNIQDLVSILKELLENSLDSGANSIKITIFKHGIEGLEVSDNGHGINPLDIPKLFSQGATSKLTSENEITSIKTLGFRGMALFSISRLSRLRIFTRTSQDSQAHKLEVENGKITKQTLEPGNIGTTIFIYDIFNDNPVRLNDLRNRGAFYLRKSIQVIENYSLVHYDKKISLLHVDLTGKKNILVPAMNSNNLLAKLQIQIGREMVKYFKEYTVEDCKCKITAFLSNPCKDIKKKVQSFYLNKRIVDMPSALKKIFNAMFRDFINMPGYVILLEMKEGFDVNVNSDKMMVYFNEEGEVGKLFAEMIGKAVEAMAGCVDLEEKKESGRINEEKMERVANTIRLAQGRTVTPLPLNYNSINPSTFNIMKNTPEEKIKEIISPIIYNKLTPQENSNINPQPTLEKQPSIKSFTFSASKPSTTILSSESLEKSYTLSTKISPTNNIDHIANQPIFPSDLNPTEISSSLNLSTLKNNHILPWTLSSISPISITQYSQDPISQNPTSNLSLDASLSFLKSNFRDLSLIGQFNKGFIITQKDQKLFIVDQHAADEKYLFETLQKTTNIVKQPLIIPKKLELNAEDESLINQYAEAFNLNGFILKYEPENPPGSRYYIHSFPLSKNTVFEVSDFMEMLESLKNVSIVHDIYEVARLTMPRKYRNMFASRACRQAVMIGTSLETRKMNDILNNLSTLNHPWNCPHGRPTIRLLRSLPQSNNEKPIPKFKLIE
ncbi:hypothetical protein SteCoe_12258 [Stentor coeruleus]|uniref:MutL C-terminal dimerisation domain-containing protein n=1 Tax=Stentor coeruleus TaxID=5963 RepID=A0A1R2CBA3_9CILI|nr:hypothetical protein SteCoe_12258 [Stentor coeruleus]